MAPVLPPLHCSFCQISDQDAVKLLAGVNGYICTECIKTCSALLGNAEDARAETVVALENSTHDAPVILHHPWIDANKSAKTLKHSS